MDFETSRFARQQTVRVLYNRDLAESFQKVLGPLGPRYSDPLLCFVLTALKLTVRSANSFVTALKTY